jgi:hypothetical protein
MLMFIILPIKLKKKQWGHNTLSVKNNNTQKLASPPSTQEAEAGRLRG